VSSFFQVDSAFHLLDSKDKSDKNWAWTNHLSERALAHAENVRSGLQGIMERLDIDLISLSDETKLFLNIRKALVCGFCTQVAHRDKTSYATVKDRQVDFNVDLI
jgi:pre-mRNA-splicing factor ATP-dependent RNA helicase DHX15/PRP43